MENAQVLNIGLQPGGSEFENNNFRTRDAYPGQVEREDIYDYGSDFNMQANLASVIHGTMDGSPDALFATLIIIDFRFNSTHASKRFCKAKIELRFRDLGPDDANPPEVLNIAPRGKFVMNKIERMQEQKRAAKLDAGVALFGDVKTGVEWSLVETEPKYSAASLTGNITKRDRTTEPRNVAIWSLNENGRNESGIPNLLRAAVLLRRKKNEQFQGGVLVESKVDWKNRPSLDSRTGKGDLDPVLFDPNSKRTVDLPPGVDPKNLGKVDLNKLMAIQSSHIVETEATAHINTTINEDMAGLALDTVVGKLENQQVSTTNATSTENRTNSSVEVDNSAHSPRSVGGRAAERIEKAMFGVTNHSEPLKLSGSTMLKVEEPVKASFEPMASVQAYGASTSIEETMRLLLDAVRKGVEVIAEANRIQLAPWPEPQHNLITSNPSDSVETDNQNGNQSLDGFIASLQSLPLTTEVYGEAASSVDQE